MLLETPCMEKSRRPLQEKSSQQKNLLPAAKICLSGTVAVTAIAWEENGFCLCVGTARGSVERLCAFRQRLKDDSVEVLVSLCNTVRRAKQARGLVAACHRPGP